MVFASGVFLYLFAPIFFCVYFACPSKHRNIVIVIGSYIFYAWWRLDFLLLLFALTCWAFAIGVAIHHAKTTHIRDTVFAIGVIVNLSTLLYFKYFTWLVQSWNFSFQRYSVDVPDILLPIGISFFTFQVVSYLVDVWRGDVHPARNFIDLAAFKAVFPQLIAGPVLRYKDLDEQFRHRTHSWEKFGEGTRRFIYGFGMKVLLADSIAPLVGHAFSQPNPRIGDAWLGIFAFTAQLFCDFAGYSSMAIGLGLMMGFRFIENFNNPYASRSVSEFWRRWHMSLSTWLRDYVYFPLGGNRKGPVMVYRNLFLTMLIGGAWHGANWTFIIYGVCQGLMVVGERFVSKDKRNPRFSENLLIGWLITGLFVLLSRVLFRANTVEEALKVYAGAFGLNGFGFAADYGWAVRSSEFIFLALAYGFIALGIREAWTGKRGSLPRNSAAEIIWLVVLLALATTRLASNSFSPFLYFQF